MAQRVIRLRGVEVHNLQKVDLDLPHRQLIAFCGVSGSGKSSLAFDTLYAEGQRRYIESFSAYTRQYLERLEKPAAELIDGIPPAIAVAARSTNRSNRSTVGTVTETNDFLRLLLARIGQVVCYGCGQEVRQFSPQSAAELVAQAPPETRLLVCFARESSAPRSGTDLAAELIALREEGFQRIVAQGRILTLDPVDEAVRVLLEADPTASPPLVVVDRLTAGSAGARLRDSLEIAFEQGHGAAWVLVSATDFLPNRGKPYAIDGTEWKCLGFSRKLRCETCQIEYPDPEPRLFSFNSSLGACPECEGFGNVFDVDLDLIVPDPRKSLRDGAIAPWNTPAYAHELEELLALADDYGLPVDVPFAQLDDRQRQLIIDGVPERKFGGLKGFFRWLERRKYKMHIRVFLARWRSYRVCPVCQGARLRPEALATQIAGRNMAQLCAMPIREALRLFNELPLTDWQRTVGRMSLDQIRARLSFLEMVGLGYLSLDRTLRTLSGGEAQRVSLTSALGSSLVNMLYVLDEPSVGLHPCDTDRLIRAVLRLRDRGNTVVVVEHEEAMIRAADQVVEIGPGAGQRGGRVVFQGTPSEMEAAQQSLTGDYLSGRKFVRTPATRRSTDHGWIRLVGARGNNLRNLTVEFPLGVLCVVTGVSGSGKSTLVQDTLYPALCRRMRKESPAPAPYDDVYGDGQLGDVLLVDQTPIGRSPRSNPVTYIKAFDDIRNVFAETLEAKMRNFTPSYFSFNVEGGRCATCQGDGVLAVDMQFLADVYMKCPDCHGRRYRREVLEVKYRGMNIAEVLDMTVREAFTFFRGRTKVQVGLKKLIDVGLDYLRLGQPANTLSGGESQRLKLAGYMQSAKRGRTLFLLDEPTTGLHFADVVQLLDCFDSLLAVGHSLIVVEHNMQVIKSADYLIDLGPGAADEGGRIVATGSPEEVARNEASITGRYLAENMAAERVLLDQQELSA